MPMIKNAPGPPMDLANMRAQAPVYLVTEINVTNPEAYGKEYSPKSQASIKAAGGHLIAIGGSGGGGANKITAVEGTRQRALLSRCGIASKKCRLGETVLTTKPHVRLVTSTRHFTATPLMG